MQGFYLEENISRPWVHQEKNWQIMWITVVVVKDVFGAYWINETFEKNYV